MSRLFNRLQTLPDPLVDRSMAAALPTADPTMRRLLALELLRRAEPTGLRGLIEHWNTLPEEIQAALVEQEARLHPILRQACALRQAAAPDHAMTLIARARVTSLAYLLVEQLRQGAEARRSHAADCLLALARAMEPGESDPASAARWMPLAESLTQALRLYGSHKRVEVLLAAFWLHPRPMPALWRLLQQLHPALPEIRRLLAEAGEPVVRRSLLGMLAQPALAADALSGLGRCAATGELQQAMGQSWLLALPGVGKILERVQFPGDLLPSTDQRRGWSVEEQLGLLRWMDRLPLKPLQRLEQLMSFRSSQEPRIRLAVLRRLIALTRKAGWSAEGSGEEKTSPVEEQIAGYCDDVDPVLARIALRYLMQARSALLAGCLTRLLRSPHPSVRELATGRLAPLGFQRLWVAWPHLTAEQRLAAGRALIKINPHFHRVLAERLSRNSLTDRLRATNMIQALGQGIFFENALMRLAASRDSRLVSAAVGAMESADAQRVRGILREALHHADARVRANAIEALAGQKEPVPAAWLTPLLEDPANRPRANAIRVLMLVDRAQAEMALRQMLRDPRGRHRVSALWVIQSLGLLSWIRPVADMASGDSELPVRQRAARVAEMLIRLLEDQEAGEEALSAGTPALAEAMP